MPSGQPAQKFCTTQWTTILNARNLAAPENAAALETLCRTYWGPLYSFARRKGCSIEDAQDLAQAFFARLLEMDYLRSVDRTRGKFRTFLLTTFTHFLQDEWDKRKRIKRGGECAILSLDAAQAEERYSRLEPAHHATPDQLYDRHWAQVAVDAVLERLRAEFDENGEVKRFDALQSSLMGELPETGYQKIAQSLGLSEGGVKTVVRRMRMRFARLLREQVAATLADPAESETEMRYLLRALTEA